jgi:O-methyltransferase
MDNFFIVDFFEWQRPPVSPRVKLINKVLRRLGFMNTLQPRAETSMTNVEQRMNLYHLASQVLSYKVPGDFVELGCNEGQSSVLIQKVIDQLDPRREFHVYDSFQGIEAPTAEDGNTPYKKGEMITTKDVLKNNFQKYGLRIPQIHQGWFHETLPAGLPEQIAFAYLDGDLYESILLSLKYVYPHLSSGAVCVIDDYADPSIYPHAWNLLPGVKKACDDFLLDKPEKVSFIYSGGMSHGFFRKS